MSGQHYVLLRTNLYLTRKTYSQNRHNLGPASRTNAARLCRFLLFILISTIQLSKDTNAFLRKRLLKGQHIHNINVSVKMNNLFRVSKGPPLRMLSDGELDFDKTSTPQEDARAFNMIVSAAVDLSDAHVCNSVFQGKSHSMQCVTTLIC